MSTAYECGAAPYAELFPMLDGTELQELADDIAEHGLHHPIVLDDQGRVLDGRNRLAACEIAKVEPTFTTYRGDDPLSFVISENVKRRHLTEGQKAGIAVAALPMYEAQAKARARANLRQNTERANRPTRERGRARDQAAKATGTSGRSFGRFKRLKERAPDLAAKVAAGDLALDRAERELRRRMRRDEIAAIKPVALDSLGPFPILYADPPWQYDFIESDSRKIENHYETTALEAIMALDVPAADDCVLFLWVTPPKVAEALEVINAWGFDYRTSMVWIKDKIGMGKNVRQLHEWLMIAKRGSIPLPEPEDRPSSVIYAPRRSHSEKPEEVHEIIERMYPHLTKCELFQRKPRDGWIGWGNEVGLAS
jgi:N6-adenosine-specific RNA methylase IME4